MAKTAESIEAATEGVRLERPMRTGTAVEQPKAGAGSFFQNTWTIAAREFRSYFDSLVAYVVIGGSMLAVGMYFFLVQGFWQVDRASMARMFDTNVMPPLSLPWLVTGLVVPLVTMRTLAEEKRTGTLELLITMPVRDSEVILGKYVAALGMVVTLFLVSLLYPIAMFKWPWHLGDLDWGPVWAAYVGLFFMSAAGVAIGLLISSLTESQIIAFFITTFLLVFLMGIGTIAESLSVKGAFGDVISFISFQTRYTPFARGLIDTRAIIYYVSVAVLCLLGAFRSLESRKWA